MLKLKNRYIGDKAFYKTVLTIAVPIMIQNAISNFVGLLDNLMIGRVGTNAISGVAIANQLIFIYYLLVFGAAAGIGIFTAQYYGVNDNEGIRYTFRMKMIVNTVITILCILGFFFFGTSLISLYLKGEGTGADVKETLHIGRSYMNIMLIGLIPCSWSQAYAGTLRETQETKVPMYASFLAVFINLIGNYVLIYGHLGLPALGAVGAAWATVISRVVELFVLVIYTATHSAKHPFIIGAFRSLRVPGQLAGKFLLKSLPLMVNEGLWASGMAILNQSYSYRSLDAVAAINIQSTLYNLMGVAFLTMGDAVGILIGQILGTGDMDKAKDHARKLTAFTVFCGLLFALFMIGLSPIFPQLYNTSADIKHMATKLIMIAGIFMPFNAFTHASYFIIRAGGRTGITMLFDSCFVWLVNVPLAFCISHFTTIDVVTMVVIISCMEVVKCFIGGIMVKKGIWARNIIL
ncbi:MAG: MATE family efflux transporter [Lachnospiraceae bacterium]|nr:MATE family efflux transporter [Lachnospiraceae bacterium]